MLTIVLMGLSMASGQEKETAAVPQQGVELLFPAGTGKQAKGAKLSKEQKKAVSLLKKLKSIEKGGNINAADKQGQTALMHAAAANNRLAVCWLIAKGADATIKSKSGKTARDLVCKWDQRIKNLLQLCCEEKLPVPSEENPDEDYDDWVVQTGKISKDNCQEKLEDSAWRQSGFLFKEAMAIRAGAHADQLRPDQSEFLSIDYPPEGLAFLIRHGMPVQPCSATKWDEATPEHLRLLLALGMTREPKDDHAKLLFALMLDDVKRLESLLKQKPDEAKIPALYGHAQSAEAVKALVAAAGGVPDATACLTAVLQNSYSSGAVKGLLEAGVPVPTDDKIVELILPDPAMASNGWWSAGLRFVDERHEDYIYINMRRSEPDVLKVLLDAGLNPNCTFDDRYKNPQTLLHRAATLGRAAAVELLLKHGANPNAVDNNNTPLSGIFGRSPINDGYYAPNVSRIVQALLKAGADPNLGRMDRRLVHIIIGEGNVNLPRNEKEGNEEVSALRALLRAGLKAPADILLNFRGGQCQRLSDAQYEEVALLLLEHGADPLVTDNDGKTTLMTAGRMGPRIAQKLLDAGVDPVVVSKRGETALKSALAQNQPEVAKLLHGKGARYSGDLFICHPDCMQIMLDDGANVPKGIYVELLYHGAYLNEVSFTSDQYSRIIELLKRTESDPDASSIEDLTRPIRNCDACPNPTARKALLSSDLILKSEKSNGSVYLFIATGHEIQDLIQAGADPHIVNKEGQTPLFRPNIKPSDIKLFVHYGVDVNAQDNQGNTALMIMSKNWWGKDCIPALLDAGADPNIKNKAGKTALQMTLQIARKEERDKIIKLLKEHGAKE